MDIKELRIGNWITINNKEVYMDEKLFHAIIHGFPGYEPNPIPLTEQWLFKFGFIQSDCEIDYMEWSKHPIRIGNDGGLDDYKNQSFFYEIEWDHKRKIEYTHQLQNLYFALTGEDLLCQ